MLLQDQPRLLVPLDGSVFAEAAVPVAAALAEDVGAELVLTRVQPSPNGVLRADDGQVLAYVDQDEGHSPLRRRTISRVSRIRLPSNGPVCG